MGLSGVRLIWAGWGDVGGGNGPICREFGLDRGVMDGYGRKFWVWFSLFHHVWWYSWLFLGFFYFLRIPFFFSFHSLVLYILLLVLVALAVLGKT